MDALSAIKGKILKGKGKVLMNSANEKRKNSLSMEDDRNAKRADRRKNTSVLRLIMRWITVRKVLIVP